MFSNWTDCVGHRKGEEKNKGKINTGNSSTYHEPLSKEWIERRS